MSFLKWLVVAAVIAGGFGLAANGHAQETPPLLGDADCSTHVSSIDAAITLQYGASLSSSVPCPASADASTDQSIDAVDANLMLQMTAGFIAGIVHMPLAVEPSSACDGDGTCTFDAGAEFQVSIGLDTLPRGGYVAFQTEIYTTLEYHPTEDVADEVLWPDAGFRVRFPGAEPHHYGRIEHGGLSSATPPFPDSVFNGTLVTMTLACPEQTGTHTIALMSYEPEINSFGSGLLALPASPRAFDARELYHSQVVGQMQGRPVSQTFTIDCV